MLQVLLDRVCVILLMSVQESERVAHKAAGHKSKSPLKRENLWKKSEKKPSQMFNDPLY